MATSSDQKSSSLFNYKFKSFLQKHSTFLILVAIGLFLFLNSIKVSRFNLSIVDPSNTYPGYVKNAIFFNALFLTAFLNLFLLRRKTPLLLIAFYCIQLLFILINLIYFFYFQAYLHLNQYVELWGETLELMKHSAVPFEPGILIVFIDLPFLVLIAIFYKRVVALRQSNLFRYSLYVPCVFMLIGVGKWDSTSDDSPLMLMNDQYMSETYVVKKFGLLVFDLLNLINMRDNSKLIHELDQGTVRNVVADTTKGPSNILIIQVESMDAFIVNQKYKGNYVTPYLHSLTKNSVYYPYMLSYHKAGSTSDCEFSCLNSAEALDHFPSIKIRNYNFPNSIAKRFAKNNYDLAIFHGNRGEYFNRKIAFPKMGFPYFYDMQAMNLHDVVWGAPDHQVYEFMEDKLNKVKEPFYYHVITMSTHEPFIFTEPYFKTKKFNGMKDTRSKNYFTCFAYADQELKKLITRVQKQFPNTYIFIYGDHTPGIRNGFYKQAAFRYNDVYFELVPLYILTPDNQKYYEKSYLASFLDIAPTALTAANCSFDLKTNGEDLLSHPKMSTVSFRGTNYSRTTIYKMANKLPRAGW